MYRVLPVPSVRIKQRIESILLRLLSPWYLHSRNNCTKQDSKYIFIVFLICGGVQLSIHWYKSPNSSAQPSTLFSLDTRHGYSPFSILTVSMTHWSASATPAEVRALAAKRLAVRLDVTSSM